MMFTGVVVVFTGTNVPVFIAVSKPNAFTSYLSYLGYVSTSYEVQITSLCDPGAKAFLIIFSGAPHTCLPLVILVCISCFTTQLLQFSAPRLPVGCHFGDASELRGVPAVVCDCFVCFVLAVFGESKISFHLWALRKAGLWGGCSDFFCSSNIAKQSCCLLLLERIWIALHKRTGCLGIIAQSNWATVTWSSAVLAVAWKKLSTKPFAWTAVEQTQCFKERKVRNPLKVVGFKDRLELNFEEM